MNVHLLYPPDPADLALLKSELDQRIRISAGEDLPLDLPIEILVAGRPTREQLASLPDLRMLIIPWVGIPENTLRAVKDFPGIAVHNLHHNAASTAELALALLFAAAKKVIRFDRELREGNWELRYAEPESTLLAGKRALLIGHGQIGHKIKNVLETLGVQVQAISRVSAPGVLGYSKELLHRLLPESELLILAVPLTAETAGMIGKDELALLPKSSILINVSRGAVVDQSALYKALRENPLFQAGLDVWYNYPSEAAERKNTLPGDYPFHELDNLVLSPHRAGLVKETETLRLRELALLLNQAAAGEPVANRVDLDLGY